MFAEANYVHTYTYTHAHAHTHAHTHIHIHIHIYIHIHMHIHIHIHMHASLRFCSCSKLRRERPIVETVFFSQKYNHIQMKETVSYKQVITRQQKGSVFLAVEWFVFIGLGS